MRSAEVVAARGAPCGNVRRVGALLLVAACGSPVLAATGPELARSQGCLGCHAVDQKVLGPAFVDVAKRYASDAAAVEKVAQRIVAGSSGVWGPVAMPAQPQLKADEATSLARWIMGSANVKP
jgi:cytochrome c